MARSPAPPRKRCRCYMPYKFKDEGEAKRKPTAELRKLDKRRRVTRHDLSSYA